MAIGIGFNYFKICRMTDREQKLIYTYHEIVGKLDTDSPDSGTISLDGNNCDVSNGEKEQMSAGINGNIDCIIRIPSIDLEKIVYTGTDRISHLDQYELITASEDMQYINGGNYIICGHASRLYGHSLNRIKELETGDVIYIDTQKGTDTYTVQKIFFANRYKCSEYFTQSQKPALTIISCARYVSDNSYIIVQAQ
jgi:LPXTG-site transpeptidase (sortase) family protein